MHVYPDVEVGWKGRRDEVETYRSVSDDWINPKGWMEEEGRGKGKWGKGSVCEKTSICFLFALFMLSKKFSISFCVVSEMNAIALAV